MRTVSADSEVGAEDEIIGSKDAISLGADTQRNGLGVGLVEVCIINEEC